VQAGDGLDHVIASRARTTRSRRPWRAPLQLLPYHIAVLRGTNVDQPRNLAKRDGGVGVGLDLAGCCLRVFDVVTGDVEDSPGGSRGTLR